MKVDELNQQKHLNTTINRSLKIGTQDFRSHASQKMRDAKTRTINSSVSSSFSSSTGSSSQSYVGIEQNQYIGGIQINKWTIRQRPETLRLDT